MEDATVEISPFPSISREADRDRQAPPANGLFRRRAPCPIGKARCITARLFSRTERPRPDTPPGPRAFLTPGG